MAKKRKVTISKLKNGGEKTISGRNQVAKKKGLGKLVSKIKTAITGKVGKKYSFQGEIRQDISKRRAKRLKRKAERKNKDSNVRTWDGGKTSTRILSRYGQKLKKGGVKYEDGGFLESPTPTLFED